MECERRRQGKLGAPSPAPVRGGPRAPRSWLRLCPSGLRDARRARPLRLLRRRVAVTPSTRHLVAGGGCRACVSPRPLWAAPRGLPVLSRLSVEVRRAPRVLTEGRYLPRAAQEPERPDASPARPPSAARPPPRPRGSPRLPRCGNAGPTGSASSWRFPQERAGTRRPSTGRRASRAQSRTRSLAEDVSALPGVGGPSHATVAARAWPACVAHVRVHFSPRGACALRLSSRIVPVCAPVAATPAGSALGPAGYGHAPSPCVSPRAEHAKHLFTRGSVWWSACPGPWLVEKLGSSVLTDSEQLLVWTAGESLAVGSRSVGRRFAFLMMLCDERVFLTVTRSSSSVILFVPD